MLVPKKVKYRKWQTGRRLRSATRNETRGVELNFGSYGLKSMSYGRITSNQIEAARKTVSRQMKKVGKMWIRVFPDRPYTAKAAEVGMGKGKGDLKGYSFEVLPGRILFEVDGLSPEAARESLRKAGAKLPLKTKVVTRE
ncbi:MAG: 50S ribosomal protein L16 [Candidatus Vogelbacteria bacterium GWA1_51_14]|uniref:Large ribosomal subunit protein uL16 n=1 Tax=Candidatus Vogelbacteria bacterium GWA1_51_14 TaxID=1802435 RepID=A0A1G2QA12_9BACT|nr:MAG: 50S ribosomal protein L16 [Candidatus Vogelbacteria bacterium GWA1_51_14]